MILRRAAVLALTILGFAALLGAQTKSPVTPADYGQFETLAPAGFGDVTGGLSPDGKWLAYGINRSNRSNELRITNIADGTTKVTAFATQPVFSSDSHWVAFAIGNSEAQDEKLRQQKKPVQRKMGLLNLSTGDQVIVDAVETFSFSPNGTYLAMRKYAPERKDALDAAAAGTDAEDNPQGATLVVRQLSTGLDTSFGNVSEFAWQDLPRAGTLLAMAINSDDKTGNGVQLFNTQTGAVRVLDSSSSVYSGLAWRKNGSDLAVLRSKSDPHREGFTYAALAWMNLPNASDAAKIFDPTVAANNFPAGMRIVSYRKPTWPEEGGMVFLGVAKWDEKITPPKKAPASEASKAPIPADGEEEPASVDIWHWTDIDVSPKQKLQARQDRQRNMLAVWHVDSGKLIPLAHDLTEQVTPLKHSQLAFATNWDSYAMDRTIGRPTADLSIVDLSTGARTKIKDHLIEDRSIQPSPGGKYLIYFQEDNYWTVKIATKAVTNITKSVKTAFVNRESDETIKQKPPFGVAGWTKDDAAVILYDKYDLWKISPDGSHATQLTDGAKDQVRHRYVRLNADEEFINADKPIYVSLYGEWTKKSGYAKLNLNATIATDEHAIWLDKGVSRLARAKDADVYEYVLESFDQSPNIFISGADLKNAKQLTNTNPFQSNYAWGHGELIDYKNSHGEHLQGALYYPAGYEPGKKYPMVVYMYEKLSDGLHRFSAPSERDYYNPAAFTAHGYFLLEPDIVFQPRDPGVSVVDCVSAATKRVIDMGVVDPKRVGVVGHSWGGFDSVYLATHTNGIFAAAVAGAPITDLVSNYGNHHWSSGIAETDHIETGQQRMEVPLYEDLPAYIRNSAVFNVQNMTTPLLIEVGDSDGTVFFHQGVELYNIARRAKKNVVLLEYAGEDHGLRKKADQIDYERRIFAWFGHYLKDETAAAWITGGESYLDRQKEVKALKAASEK
jgi:dipeptidyl aminopeptidase/acylaminoacyl peptidase